MQMLADFEAAPFEPTRLPAVMGSYTAVRQKAHFVNACLKLTG
jgi:hypothetical protein